MKKHSINVTQASNFHFDDLPKNEQKTFLKQLFARMLELQRQQLFDKEE